MYRLPQTDRLQGWGAGHCKVPVKSHTVMVQAEMVIQLMAGTIYIMIYLFRYESQN